MKRREIVHRKWLLSKWYISFP